MNVLVIAPHQDDEVLGCGGVMARHAAEGDTVHVVVVTRGIASLFPPVEIEATRRELHAALEVLSVSGVQFLEFPAPQLDLVARHELAEAIQRVIYSLQAQILYVPHAGDIHFDHRAVFEAALVAARPINRCPVERIVAYETLSETEWGAPSNPFVPSLFVDISQHLQKKLQAMSCYKSQLKDPPHPRSLAGLKALARYRGYTIGTAAAEAFMVVRHIIR